MDAPYDSGANSSGAANVPEELDMSGWTHKKLQIYIQRGLYLLHQAIAEREKYDKNGMMTESSRRDVQEMLQYLKNVNVLINSTNAGGTENEGGPCAGRVFDINLLPVTHVPWQNSMGRWTCEQLTAYIENILKLLMSASAKLQQLNKGKKLGAAIDQVDQSSSTQAEGMQRQNVLCASSSRFTDWNKSMPNSLSHESSSTKRGADEECSEHVRSRKKQQKNSLCAERSRDVPCDSGLEVRKCSESTCNFSLDKASKTDKESGESSQIGTEKMHMRNLLWAEGGQDAPCTSGHPIHGCAESTSDFSLHEASRMEKEPGRECTMDIESSRKHTRNSICAIGSQDVPCTSDHQVPYCNKSASNFPTHEATGKEKKLSKETQMEIETGSDNLHDPQREDQTVQASQDGDPCPSTQANSTPVVQTESESVTEMNPGIIAANTLLESMAYDSSEAIVILKVSKSNREVKTNPALKKEKDSVQYQEKDTDCVRKELEVQDSEILWSLFCVRHQLPYSTFNAIGFQSMFPDSNSAHLTINHRPERLAYIVSYGLEVYFRMELLHTLEKNEHCVLVFKELFYDASAGYKQIDIYIRFWNVDTNHVEMRYLNSVYIEFDGEIEDVTDCIWGYLKGLENCRIIQLCLDGSTVSMPYLSYLQKKLEKHFAYNIVDINNSLHSIYEAFERGAQASEWKLDDILRSLYLIFKDSPERCAEYIKITQYKALPLPFYDSRLLLNIKTAERAFEIWYYIKKYVSFIHTEYPSLFMSNCFATLKQACEDVLMPVKLKFFISIGKRIEGIINLFQSEKPMLPFFYRKLKAFEIKFKNYFDGKKYGYPDTGTVDKLVDFELDNNSSTLLKDVHLGFSADKILKEFSRDQVTAMQEIVMKAAAQEFVSKLNEKLLNDPYLNNPLFECLSCLDPLYVISNTEDCNNKFAHILSLFMEKNHLFESMCEDLQEQFSVFLDDAVLYHKNDFKNFDSSDDNCRLDTFLHCYLSDMKFEKLWHFVKGLLLLFNGQVDSTECVALDDFTEIKVDYTARRLISDHLKGCDTNIVVTNEMRQVVNDALQNYMNLDTNIGES